MRRGWEKRQDDAGEMGRVYVCVDTSKVVRVWRGGKRRKRFAEKEKT